jgi:hypothetical protein
MNESYNEQSTIIDLILSLIKKNKILVILVVVFSFCFSFYMKSNYKPTFTSSAILDFGSITDKEIAIEIINDFFYDYEINSSSEESSSHHILQNHKIKRLDKSNSRFVLSIFISSLDSISSIENSLRNYVLEDPIISSAIIQKSTRYDTLISLTKRSLNVENDFKSIEIKDNQVLLELTQLVLKYKSDLISYENANTKLMKFDPFVKAFGSSTSLENINYVFLKNLLKALLSGLLLIGVVIYIKSLYAKE